MVRWGTRGKSRCGCVSIRAVVVGGACNRAAAGKVAAETHGRCRRM